MDSIHVKTKTGDVHKPERRTPRSVLLEREKNNLNGKHCSTLVGSLILAISLLVICCVVLLNLYLIERGKKPKQEIAGKTVAPMNSTSQIPKPQSHHGGLCWSTDCIHAASDLLNSIDPSADPCQDFYQYACGGWMKKNPLPPGSSRWDQFKKLDAETNKVIEMFFKSKELKAKYSKEEAVWKTMAYYDSCMDTEEKERLKGKPLERLISEYGSWSVTNKTWREEDSDLITNLARIHKYLAISVLFLTTVRIDRKNTSKNVIMLSESMTLLGQRNLLTNSTKSHRIREAYKGLMRNVTRKLGAIEGFEDDLLKVFEFEKELAKINTPPHQRPKFGESYNKLTIQKLQEYTGEFFNWTRYFKVMMEENSYQVDDQAQLVVESLEYLKRLVKLLEITPKRTVANYLMWAVVKNKYLYLSRDFVEVFKFYYLQAFNSWSESDQQYSCMFFTSHLFGLPLSKIFLDHNFYGNSKKSAMDVAANIQSAFIDNLEKEDWMDNETRQAAKRKAESVIENLGFPDNITDVEFLTEMFKKVQIHPKTYFDNDVSIKKNRNLQKLAKAGTDVDKSEWPFPPTTPNAHYSYSENKMVFPAAVLQPPLFNVLYPRAINYGAIGGVMAHELTHGFDDKGKLFDSKGNLSPKWWSNWTLANYQAKTLCLVDQFSNYTFYGYKVSGKKTLSENIADGGGATIALEAYRKWVRENWEEPRLPGMMLSNEQVFFISFARNWCSHYSKRGARLVVKSSRIKHSPMPWRVNGTLKNFPEFSKAFNCPLGSAMNPEKKCKVW